MLDQIYKDTRGRMAKTVDSVKHELGTIRTGKASTHILDSIVVDAYGSTMPLNQVATVTAPEARLLLVQAFDKNTVGDIVKAIQKADLGLNPSPDGQLIRIPVPPLNEERRKNLVKQCHRMAEDGKVAVRNIRRDANDSIKKAEKDKDISEDQRDDGFDEVQKATDEFIKQIDEVLAQKEKEVMEV